MGRTEDLAAVDTALTRIGREATSRRAQRLRAERSRVDISALGVSVLAAIYRHGPLTLRNVADLDLRATTVGQYQPQQYRS